MSKYEPVIGLEVHVELNTKSKMFCRCSAEYFGKEPNTHTCPTCLGLPGALPYINEEAIKSCMKIGLALHCKIAEKSLFERKNYFYPDLPKGYQISQYRWPLCIGGWLVVSGKDNKEVKIRINRAHQEEDTGKLVHRGWSTEDGENNLQSPTSNLRATLVDFNRSGVPLVEIVTEPDFTEVEQIRDYAKKLQQLFRYLGVSNADMERGDMRLEANVSVRMVGQTELPQYRVELKNINSFRFMVAAVEYEIKRQTAAIEAGEKLSQETRGWDEDKKCTYLQRSKEEAHDYRYFPEPDLPELKVSDNQIDQIRSELPELPWDKAKRFEKDLGISGANAKILSENKELAQFFEDCIEHAKLHNISTQEVVNYLVNKKPDINSLLPTEIIEEIKGKKVGIIDSDEELEKLAKQSIAENPKSVVDYKSGKENALQALIGGVMKLSSGKADARKTKGILENLLKNPT